MKKQLQIILSFLVLLSCSSVKNTQEAINKGNYTAAISLAVKKLQKNKTKKGNQPYINLLEDGFKKIITRDLNRIDYLKKDNNPENLEKIYNSYVNLNNIQNNIKPLLPLHITKEGRDAEFNFSNFNKNIIEYKEKVSEYLYKKAKKIFLSNNKLDYRNAYSDLEYIEKVNANYKDVRNLMDIAHQRGLDFVFVSMKNQTQKVIPKRLEEDLLNFDTYGLNDFWTVYHGAKDPSIRYDFGLELNLRNIQVSPEQVREKEIIKEKEVKDGFRYLLDKNGKHILDSEGNKVKVDKLVKVRCELYQFTQLKSAQVTGQVRYIDLNTRQTIQTYPITSEFSFQHIYANSRGDKRALDQSFLDLIALRVVPFPTNEQMIYDTGQDLKERLKSIITRNKFRD